MSDARCVVQCGDWHSACAEAAASGATYFDCLSAVELADGSGVDWVLHIAVPGTTPIVHRFIATSVGYNDAVESISDVYVGAAWHEREAHEMFGLQFTGHPDLRPLLLTDVDLRPLRKSFTLPPRVDTAWPGAEGRKRPLGVPADGDSR